MQEILSKLVITKVYTTYTLRLSDGQKIQKTNRNTWGLIIKRDDAPTPNATPVKKFLAILPKGATYEWVCTKPGNYTIVDFESALSHNKLIPLTIEKDGFYEQTLNALEQLFLYEKDPSTIESIHLVYSIILHALKQQNENPAYAPSSKKKRLQPAMNYILNNFTSPIKNEELAALCKISAVYFRKLWSEVYGVPPMTYIQNLRIQRAQEMLKSDYTSITDIAFTLGYNNIYEFSKAFKNHTGVSPSKYQA